MRTNTQGRSRTPSALRCFLLFYHIRILCRTLDCRSGSKGQSSSRFIHHLQKLKFPLILHWSGDFAPRIDAQIWQLHFLDPPLPAETSASRPREHKGMLPASSKTLTGSVLIVGSLHHYSFLSTDLFMRQ